MREPPSFTSSEKNSKVVAQRLERMESQRLSLAFLEKYTGIGRSNLSRLWNNPSPNVILDTVERIAAAMNCRLEIIVEPDT